MTRRGYTLMELMLVMAIIIVIAAIGYPVMESMFSPARLAGSADAVRGRFADARAQAMNDGRAYKFSIKPNTPMMRIEQDDSDGSVIAPDGYQAEAKLPDGCMFVKDFGALGNKTATGGGDWEPVVIFNADGTAQADADVMFGVMGQTAGMTLHVRALTGHASKVTETTDGK